MRSHENSVLIGRKITEEIFEIFDRYFENKSFDYAIDCLCHVLPCLMIKTCDAIFDTKKSKELFMEYLFDTTKSIFKNWYEHNESSEIKKVLSKDKLND